jgi:hypothetical protein
LPRGEEDREKDKTCHSGANKERHESGPTFSIVRANSGGQRIAALCRYGSAQDPEIFLVGLEIFPVPMRGPGGIAEK